MDIKLLPREEIDKTKWNSCVHYATNGSIFGYLWYLDATARHWDGLVQGDYEAVMPLPYVRSGWRGEALRQPALIRNLGVYSIHSPAQERINAFWAAIPAQYRRIQLSMDAFSAPVEGDWKVEEVHNYYLPLLGKYEALRQRYSPSRLAELDKAADTDFFSTTSIKPEQLAEQYRAAYASVSHDEFHGLQRIMYNVLHRGWGFATSVIDRDQNLLAADFFIYSHGRVMSLAPVQTPAGAAVGALAHLYDAVIRNHAGKPQALDFNTHRLSPTFAKGFGAVAYTYHQVGIDTRRI
ncbi:MAG: hypothetical protein KDC54_16590, partial [Lewinella sp.]|nr:hypothetical protein [Lewinella sp.]